MCSKKIAKIDKASLKLNEKVWGQCNVELILQ